MASRSLVTGGLGFVGSALTTGLARGGDEVLVVDDLSLGRADNVPSDVRDAVSIAETDIRDEARIREVVTGFRPDVIYHLAAIHFIPACDRDPVRAIAVNVEGTQSVLGAAAAVDALRAVVFSSTAAVYAPQEAAHTESSPIGPTDIYGLTKLWGEQLVDLFHRKTNVPVGVARLFNVFGPGETNPHLIPTIIRQMQSGSELHLGNLSTRRDYVFASDVATALTSFPDVLDQEARLVCNVGSEESIDGNNLVEMIGGLLGVQPKVTTDPDRVRASDRPNLLSDASRAREKLSWKREKDLATGLKLAIEHPLAEGIDVR